MSIRQVYDAYRYGIIVSKRSLETDRKVLQLNEYISLDIRHCQRFDRHRCAAATGFLNTTIQYTMQMLDESTKSLAKSPTIVVALREGLNSKPELAQKAPESPEGFALVPIAEEETLYIVGSDIHGALYGMVWLADQIRLKGNSALLKEDVRAPVFRYRGMVDAGSFTRPPGRGEDARMERNLRYSLNTVSIHSGRSCVFLNRIDPRLVNDLQDHEKKVQTNRKNLLAQLGHHESMAHADLGRLLTIPGYARFGQPHRDLWYRSERGWPDTVSRPGQTLDIWEAMQQQFLHDFPQIDGLRATLQDFDQRYAICMARGPKAEALGPVGAMRRFAERIQKSHRQRQQSPGCDNHLGQSTRYVSAKRSRRDSDNFQRDPLQNLCLQNNECEHDFYLNSPSTTISVSAISQRGLCFRSSASIRGSGKSRSISVPACMSACRDACG